MFDSLSIDDYHYSLPAARIASHPLSERDASRLLLYRQGNIEDRYFKDIPSLLSPGSMMVFNNTRVVPARLFFAKESGALIEIFCLEPIDPMDYNLSFAQTESVVWKAVVGNKKRWKSGSVYLYNPNNQDCISKLSLSADCVGQDQDVYLIRFQWKGGMSFSEVLELCGRIPIPPYLGRESEEMDIERYQTIYATWKGSVAAPTAGLHFSDNIIRLLKDNNICLSEVTLHVGAGTFMPVKSEMISEHHMHSEPFTVSLSFLERLALHRGPVIAVGTTSVRCMESLYYFGLMCHMGKKPLFLSQWDAYTMDPVLSRAESLALLIAYLKESGFSSFSARTQIIIVPSFKFRWTDGLITNFHQPKSTLLLLVAAFIGEDWRKCYAHALEQEYRFLSYGDSSLLLPLNL